MLCPEWNLKFEKWKFPINKTDDWERAVKIWKFVWNPNRILLEHPSHKLAEWRGGEGDSQEDDDYDAKYSWVWCNNQQNLFCRNELQLLTFHFHCAQKNTHKNKQTSKQMNRIN